MAREQATIAWGWQRLKIGQRKASWWKKDLRWALTGGLGLGEIGGGLTGSGAPQGTG